jgi:hypothetical protein
MYSGSHEDRPDDGGSTDLWNVGKLTPVYTALQPSGHTRKIASSWTNSCVSSHTVHNQLPKQIYNEATNVRINEQTN